jgi:hypothetical protein
VSDISELIRRITANEQGAQDALFAAAYDELRMLERSRLRDSEGNTVRDTTSLAKVAVVNDEPLLGCDVLGR